MHFREGEHHYPPCLPAANLQRTTAAAAGPFGFAVFFEGRSLFLSESYMSKVLAIAVAVAKELADYGAEVVFPEYCLKDTRRQVL